MPLISKKTDLRSLRYGNDRPGGGSSGQPYIQKSIPSPEEDPSNIFNTGGKDILLRGGILAPIKGVNDVSRLSQMFFDFKSPSGPLFTAKQNLLSRTSVKTEASKGAGYGGGGVNQGVYLPTSTIAQAGVGFTGTHLNLLGLNPFDPVSPDRGGTRSPLGLNSYFNIVKNQDTENNRLVGLQDAISSGKSKIKFGGQKGVDLNINGGTILLEYGGGPGSILGIGKTKIKFADQRTGDNNPLAVSSPEYFNKGGVKLHTSDDTNSYLSTIGGTNITDSHNVENNELLLNGDNQVISPFTLNNKLIDNVVPKDEIKIYASTPEDTPKISYATSILNLSSPNNSATLKYNNQTQNINGSSLPIESYNSAEGFSVYQDKDIAKYSPLQRVNNSLTLTQGQIIEEPENFGKLSGNPAIKDFRRSLIGPGDSSTIMSLAPDYGGGNAKNIEERLSLGDPGKTRNVLKYSVDQLALDKINARPFYSAASPDHRGISDGNDLVKFSIGILQNDGKGMSNYIHFRAFIEGFSDSYNANWSDTQYVGRGEKFYNYLKILQ